MKYIPLTRDKVAIVDDEDFDKLNKHNWYAFKDGNTFYAARSTPLPNGTWRLTLMHRVILGLKRDDKLRTDHRNHNGLDNRRKNLRVCTNAQNTHNSRPHKHSSSRYKGVSWCAVRGKWLAQIKTPQRHINLGRFTSEMEAAEAYDAAALQHFGEFAYINTY